MACGCASRRDLKQIRASAVQVNAAICATCPDGGTNVTVCVSGRPISEHILGVRQCPLNRHAAPDGSVRWLGVRWYGLPAPLRWYLFAFHPSHRKPGWWGGCGCVSYLRDLWDALQNRITPRLAGWRAGWTRRTSKPA